jgi:hypothetical protein
MSLQVVTINETDGALGTLPAGVKPLVLVGPSTGGSLAVNTPASYARTKDVSSAAGRGPLVEAAARWIGPYGRPGVLVRTAASTPATLGTIDVSLKSGTSAVTSGTSLPDDAYEPYVKVTKGGTIGTAGIEYQDSIDGGRTLSAVKQLGTATALTLEGYLAGTGTFLFAAGTLVTGDVVRRRDNAPAASAADFTAALAALAASAINWEICEIVGAIDATIFDAIETAFAGMPEKMWVGGVRMPNPAESEAAYLSAQNTAFSAKATTRGMLCAGAAKISSPLTGRSYRRPIATVVAPLLCNVSEEIDISAVDFNLPGVTIRDVNGNPDEHDEAINPGLDDARFTVLRTNADVAGVFVNNPRLFSAFASDFEFAQHRRIMILARLVLRGYFVRRLSKPIIVSATTGYILESEAIEIETGANALLRAVLRAKPKASDVSFTLSRTDNLLSTKTLTGQASIVPLAYPKAIALDIGFKNPALSVVKA